MSDLRFKFDTVDREFDLDIENWELESDDGLETSVLISLFSDARAESEELPLGERFKRGFWGDAVDNEDSVKTGSLLWLLEREKSTDETLERAKEYCENALQWLIDDQVAETVTVETSYLDKSTMKIEVEITRPSGDTLSFRFDHVWEVRGSGIPASYS